MTRTKKPPVVRWAIRRDTPRVLTIDSTSDSPWTEQQYLELMGRRNVVGMVAENRRGKIVGFMVYALETDRLRLLKLVVDPRHRGRGYGSALLAKFRYKLNSHGRDHAVFYHECRYPELRVDPRHVSEDVRLLALNDPPPLFALADALEEAGFNQPLILESFRLGGRFADGVFQFLKPSLTRNDQDGTD